MLSELVELSTLCIIEMGIGQCPHHGTRYGRLASVSHPAVSLLDMGSKDNHGWLKPFHQQCNIVRPIDFFMYLNRCMIGFELRLAHYLVLLPACIRTALDLALVTL